MESPEQKSISHPQTRSDQLRGWYLARLRSLAFADATNLTPAALMNADRKFIEQLLLDEAAKQEATRPETQQRQDTSPFQFLSWWLSGLILIMAFLLIENGDLSRALSTLYLCTIGTLLFQDSPDSSKPDFIQQLLIAGYFFLVPFIHATWINAKLTRSQ
jgi:hypothetical protein